MKNFRLESWPKIFLWSPIYVRTMSFHFQQNFQFKIFYHDKKYHWHWYGFDTREKWYSLVLFLVRSQDGMVLGFLVRRYFSLVLPREKSNSPDSSRGSTTSHESYQTSHEVYDSS